MIDSLVREIDNQARPVVSRVVHACERRKKDGDGIGDRDGKKRKRG